MRKFIAFFLFVILIFGDASAVSVCADEISNCETQEMDETISASNWNFYDYWAAECDVGSPANGTSTVRYIGVGECVRDLELADDGVTAINVERYTAGYNSVCVCRLLGPYVSPWIVSPNQWGGVEGDCMRYCAQYCKNIILNPGSDAYNAMIYPLSE